MVNDLISHNVIGKCKKVYIMSQCKIGSNHEPVLDKFTSGNQGKISLHQIQCKISVYHKPVPDKFIL